MEQMNFGEVLRQARERRGYDLASAARRLRIRPDILRSIEACDFDRMPPRGYTRNMVNAYARLVGLNPTEVTRMYIDQAYAHQVGKARSNAAGGHGFETGPARGRRTRGESARSSRAVEPMREDQAPKQNAFGRTLYDDRRTAASIGRTYASDRVHPARGFSVPDSHYNSFVAAPRNIGNAPSRVPYLIGGAVVIVLVVAVLFFVFGPKGSAPEEDVPDVPITGLTDTSNQAPGGAGEVTPEPVLQAPTSVLVTYELPDGVPAYAVITVDGTESQVMLEGPVKESVDVTGTWSIATWVPDLTVSVDGEEIEATGKNSAGMPLYEVDFAAYLAEWEEEHPSAAAGDDAGEEAGAEGAEEGSGAAAGGSGEAGATA